MPDEDAGGLVWLSICRFEVDVEKADDEDDDVDTFDSVLPCFGLKGGGNAGSSGVAIIKPCPSSSTYMTRSRRGAVNSAGLRHHSPKTG